MSSPVDAQNVAKSSSRSSPDEGAIIRDHPRSSEIIRDSWRLRRAELVTAARQCSLSGREGQSRTLKGTQGHSWTLKGTQKTLKGTQGQLACVHEVVCRCDRALLFGVGESGAGGQQANCILARERALRPEAAAARFVKERPEQLLDELRVEVDDLRRFGSTDLSSSTVKVNQKQSRTIKVNQRRPSTIKDNQGRPQT